jgi:hypothetical protein
LVFQFYGKTFLQSVDRKQHVKICQIFTLINHLTFPKGRCKESQGRCACSHTTSQNLVMGVILIMIVVMISGGGNYGDEGGGNIDDDGDDHDGA